MRLLRRGKPPSASVRASAVFLLAAAPFIVGSSVAHAARSTLRTFDSAQGLSETDGACLVRGHGGDLLLCTQHGVFDFDGRRFINLGTAQHLRDGGLVHNLAVARDGRVAIAYDDAVFVSGQPTSSDAASSLSFRPVPHPEISFYNGNRPHRLVPWKGGFVFLTEGSLFEIPRPGASGLEMLRMPYELAERETLTGAEAVFSVRGHLWASFDDDRLCSADPGTVTCYDAADGLSSGPWLDVVAGSKGQILARSASSVATFDPLSRRWSVVRLPDQGGTYRNYRFELGLFRTPNGRFMTQAADGIDLLGAGGWKVRTVAEGAPDGTIMAAASDLSGGFWFQVLGRGLVRWVGYDSWESIQKVDGLSSDIAWQTARANDGSVWISTDKGLDRIIHSDSVLKVDRVVPGSSFALAFGPNGDLWSGHGADGILIVALGSDRVTKINLPPVDVIAPGRSGVMWLGTEKGLYLAITSPGIAPALVKTAATTTSIYDVISDKAGGAYYIAGNRLRHQSRDGVDVPVSGVWPSAGFEPYELAFDHTGTLWIAGVGGVFRVTLSDNRIVSLHAIPETDILGNSVSALMVDHRGWVWVGSTLGISVYDGRRWVSIDSEDGLIGDDVNQGGIREDPDGSLWITTTQGVSHLLDPALLFLKRPFRVAVSAATIGSRRLDGREVPFNRDPFDVQVGTETLGAESITFKYRLSHVDSVWQASSSGLIHYPFVPPGRHTLTIIGVNELAHCDSAPVELTIKIGWPWWKQWWFEIGWVLGAVASSAGVFYVVERFRLRLVFAQQKELRRLVEERTAELRFVAEHDKLTGLLTRSEVETRLMERLACPDRDDELAVALIDVDHFKQINDTHGHLAGDFVLSALGRLVSRCLSADDFAGRYGGEEILLVFADATGRTADRILEFLHLVRGTPFVAKAQVVRITCSGGIAWAQAGDDWESLIGRADHALYEAKRQGRDRVVEGACAGRLLRGSASLRGGA